MTIPQMMDAMVTFLNASAPFSTATPPIVAVRTYLPLPDLASGDLEGTAVYVVAQNDELSQISRDYNQEDVKLNIAVIQHLPQGTLPTDKGAVAFTDGMIAFCQSVAQLFKPHVYLDTAQKVPWHKTTYAPIYDAAILKNELAFFGVISVTFRQFNNP